MENSKIIELAESLGLPYEESNNNFYFHLPKNMIDGDIDDDEGENADNPVFFVWRNYNESVICTKYISIDEDYKIYYHDTITSDDFEVIESNIRHLYSLVKSLNELKRKFKENYKIDCLNKDFK